MNIECPSCSASYNLDPSRIPADGMSMRCPKCSHSFQVHADGRVASGEPAGKTDRLYVKRTTGKVFGPFDQNAIEMMIKSDKLGSDAEVSADKSNWSSIITYPAFAGLLNEAPLPSFSGDPKATQMGGWRGGGAPELPTPVAKPSISSGLPKPPPLPGGGSNLPSPALPKKLKTPGLPDLPVRANADLPASAAGLPASAAGLPASAAGLPASAAGLPASASALPASAAGLPASAGGHDLPALAVPAGTPGRTLGPGLPVIEPVSDDDDLFGGGTDDDLFGESGSELNAASDVDLFGAQSEPDDLFAERSEVSEADLFGGDDAGDDLFVGNEAGGNEDFLSGDAGFSFLDDQPSQSGPEPSDAWGDDLFGERSEAESSIAAPALDNDVDEWGDDLLSEKPSAPQAPLVDADDPFRPKSRGIESGVQEPVQEEANQSKDAAVDDDKKRGNLALLVLPVALLVLGGVGYYVYTNVISNTEITQPKTTKTTKPVAISASSVANDTFDVFSAVVDPAVNGKVTPDKVGELLFIESLMLTRYKGDAVQKQAEGLYNQLKSPKTDFEKLGKGAYDAKSGNAEAARAYLEPISGADGEIGYFSNALMGIADVISIEKEIAENVKKAGQNAKKEEAATNNTAAQVDGEKPTEGENPPEKEVEKLAQNGTNNGTNNTNNGTNNVVAEEKADDYGGRVERATQALSAAQKIIPDAPLATYWKGRLAAALGKTDEARKAYESVVAKNEGHVAARVELGQLHYIDGNLNESIKNLEKITAEYSKTAAPSELADAHHHAGIVHVSRNQSQLAIDNFVKALSYDSGRATTLRALAEEYERAKKFKEALNFFTTNKNLGQDDPEVMLGIVRSHIGLEQWNLAISRLEEAQKQFPTDARFPVNLGQLFMKRGAYFDAQKPLERAVEIDPTLLTAHATLAQLAWRNKDLEKGEEHIGEIVKQGERIDAKVASLVADYYHISNRRETAHAWYREALNRDRNHWPAKLALARLLLEEKKYDDARAILEKARGEGVEDVRLSAYLADAYRQSGEFDRAIDEVQKVIEAFPTNEEYLFILGRIEFDRGNYETARDQFNKAYEINPQYHEAYFYVGRANYEQGEYETALQLFRHVLDRQPNRGEYRFYMARALEKVNRTSQALDEYRKATAVDKAYGVENPMVYVYRGQLLDRLGYQKEGKADIAKALELSPDNTEALIAMANTEFAEKAYKDAIRNYKKALAEQPAKPKAQYRLGMSYLYSDNNRDAASHLQLAVKHGYKNPDVYKNLGYVYKDLGQRSLAKESFSKYLEITKTKNIPNATKREVLEQINKL